MSLIIVASLEHSSARKPYHAMRGCRRIGSPFTGNGTTSTTTASLGSLRVHEKRVIRRWRIIKMTMRASSLPGHILGPPPKGTNVNGAGPAPSKRDGSNLSGFGKYLGFRWVELGDHTICARKINACYGCLCSMNDTRTMHAFAFEYGKHPESMVNTILLYSLFTIKLKTFIFR